MWQRLKNVLLSFQTYGDLSPDLKVRRRVNRALRDRPALTVDQWYEYFWQPHKISKEVAAFVYRYLAQYSGLQVARMIPGDRLNEDLQLPLVCWFDWELRLCEDFQQCFGVDISECPELYDLSTVEEFVVFLNCQSLSVHGS